ncbi:MAG: PadR family transcriptional regulator [Calothrix sp. MO_167.B12]|nr:PadR family transcriptional regulator [Calothrix sp. MO_167.B12]
MALAQAVMSLLAHKAYSGYEIAKEFAGSIGYFWQATHQQIYRELKKLETEGWVSVEVISQGKALDKKVYHLTELGKQYLIEWIDQECELGAIKEDILVKIFSGHLVPGVVLIQQLEMHLRQHMKKLAIYEGMAEKFAHHPEKLLPDELCKYMTLRRGIICEQEWIRWCEESIEILQNLAQSPRTTR